MSHPLEAILAINDQKKVVLGMFLPLFSFEVCVFWQAGQCVSVMRKGATFQLPLGYTGALGSCKA